MRVVIVGGHGQIARHLGRRLVERGDEAVGVVRNPDHVADLEADGFSAVVHDLEQVTADELAQTLSGAGAVVFAAGGGPDGNARRKETVDKGGAVLLADAAEKAGVRRYLMVSSIGAGSVDLDTEPDPEKIFEVYLHAKAAADAYLRARNLDWTIVQPGRLTDEEATGLVAAGPDVERGEIPRDDVAATLVSALRTDATIGKQFHLVGGEVPIDTALAQL